MDYYQSMKDNYVHNVMYPESQRINFFAKKNETSKVVIEEKNPFRPIFMTTIQGNAVEEGVRIFFEGIVSAHPPPKFSWYFEDEEIIPGQSGWEDVEIYHSRKMSTLIIKYCREYHMGKYTLVSSNRMGHSKSSCDLIVRKKQFPPVFWKRLTSQEYEEGHKLRLEVEVGGWPIPQVIWYKEGILLKSRLITENYNGFPNDYVPEKTIRIYEIDSYRHALEFNTSNEKDTGLITVIAINPLGEAVSEAEIKFTNSNKASTYYLPTKWKDVKRLNWKDEDFRLKKCIEVDEPEESYEEIQQYTSKRNAPLSRSLEYLASLPDYQIDLTLLKRTFPMTYDPEPSHIQRDGSRGGEPTRPSRFTPGTIKHHQWNCDFNLNLTPMWKHSTNSSKSSAYTSVIYPKYPEKTTLDEPLKASPPCPHDWESHSVIEELYVTLNTFSSRTNKFISFTKEREEKAEIPPDLPPKTKSCYSKFSETSEFLSVKEKVKMITQQQEELEFRKDDKVPGGVRILPPSPLTVRRDSNENCYDNTNSSSKSVTFYEEDV